MTLIHNELIRLTKETVSASQLATHFASTSAPYTASTGESTITVNFYYRGFSTDTSHLLFHQTDADMVLLFGEASMKLSFDIKIFSSDYDNFEVNNVNVEVSDLYDFNYFRAIGTNSHRAAMVQAGHPNSGNTGKIFYTQLSFTQTGAISVDTDIEQDGDETNEDL